MVTAIVTTRAHGQSVQLPEGFQLDTSEVYVKRVGRSVADPWEIMAESLEQFTGDFVQDRAQPAEQRREAMFE